MRHDLRPSLPILGCTAWHPGCAQDNEPVAHDREQHNHKTPRPDELFEQVNKVHLETGKVRFMNVTAKLGFDIFDEAVDEPV